MAGNSQIFRWGVYLLALALALIAYNALMHSPVTNTANLQTLEGTVIEYRTESASQRYGVGSGKRFRGSARPVNILRIQARDGNLTEFSSSEWIRPPKFGWHKGQPIRVKYGPDRSLYEVTVGDELLQDVASTQQRQKESGKSGQTLAALLLVVGLALSGIGYVASRRHKPAA